MGKTNFTVVRPWNSIVMVLFLLIGTFAANAQTCDEPVAGAVSNIGETTADFYFESQNAPVADHCWNFYIGNEGFNCDENEEFIAATICTINGVVTTTNNLVSNVNIDEAAGEVSFSLAGLQPGTQYEWNLFETCDGVTTTSVDCTDAAFGPFITLDAPFTVAMETTVNPSCPLTSAQPSADGEFTVTITDGNSCAGTYDITIGGAAATPANMAGVTAGTYTFTNATASDYTVTVTETSGCNLADNPTTTNYTVVDGSDTDAPIFTLYDLVLGTVVADNDPSTTPSESVDLGSFQLPEGECSYQEHFTLNFNDACDGINTDNNTFGWSNVTVPATVDPATQAHIGNAAAAFAELDVQWSVGASTLTLTATDATGNEASLTVTREGVNGTQPTVSLSGAQNITIPVCDDNRDVLVTVNVADLCDQDIDASAVSFDAAGATLVSNTATSFQYSVNVTTANDGDTWTATYGGVSSAMTITVEQAGANLPAVIDVPGNLTYTMAHCESTLATSMSVQVWDDCEAVDAAAVIAGFDAGTSGLTMAAQGGAFVITGDLAAGSYDLSINYGGSTAAWTINVTQEANQAPQLVLPGNLNFTIPTCDDEMLATFAVQISDDCDAVDILAAQTVTTNGFTGDFAEANWDVTSPTGTSVTFTADQLAIHGDGDIGPFDGGDLDLDGIDVFASITVPSAGTLNFDYSYTTEDQGWDWFVITIDGDVRAADEFNTTGSVNEVLLGGETLVIGIDDDGTFANYVSDLVISNFSFTSVTANLIVTLGGENLVPVYMTNNGQAMYVEYAALLSADNNGDALVASYTDTDGATTTVDAAINVLDQLDNWAPIVVYPSQDITVDLGSCGGTTAIVPFEVTATDNCDGDINPTIAIAGADDVVILDGVGGDTYMAILSEGSYTVVITAEDAAGNTRTEDFVINVLAETPVTPSFACNNSINVTLNDACQAELTPDMLLEGEFGCLEADDFVINVFDANPANGAIIDGCGEFNYTIDLAAPADVVGFTGPFAAANWTITTPTQGQGGVTITATTMTMTALDAGPFDGTSLDLPLDVAAAIAMPANGNMSFDYEYNDGDPGWDWYLIDLDGTALAQGTFEGGNGSIDENVTAGQVLLIGIDDDGLLPINGTDELVVSNFVFAYAGGSDANGLPCWGTLVSEDKTSPVIECADETNQVTYDEATQMLTGSLTSNDPTITLNDYSCFQEGFTIATEENHYDVFTFTVNQADAYTFYGVFQTAFDFTGALYAGEFDPANPCANMVAQNNNVTDVNFAYWAPAIRLSAYLEPGQTYSFVTSATGLFGTSLTGDYLWAITSDNTGAVSGLGVQPIEVTRDLVCTDIDEIAVEGTQSYVTDAAGNILSISPSLKAILDLTGYPVVSDNCGDLLVTVSDVQENWGDCGDVTITRTFTVADRYNSDCTGNAMTASCTQVITVGGVSIDDVVMPPLTATIECDETIVYDNNGNPAPEMTGYPWFQTAFNHYDLSETHCMMSASYVDGTAIEFCENGSQFVRTWTIFPMCDAGGAVTFNQTIKVGDYTAPVAECHEVDLDNDGNADTPKYSVGPFGCTASFPVLLPEVTDNCGTWTVDVDVVTTYEQEVYGPFGQVVIGYETVTEVLASFEGIEGGYTDYNGPFVSGIEKGCHSFVYTVTDNCGNSATSSCPFIVEDAVAPTAACDDDLNISIGGEGVSRIYAEDIDEGSNDNCSDVRLEVRRQFANGTWSAWGEYVDFDCTDVHEQVTIEMRVWDDANMNGTPGDTDWVQYECLGTQELVTDNYNICWLDVLVEDKLNPYCSAPQNQSLYCDEEVAQHIDIDDINWLNDHFGEATGSDNCSATAEQVNIVDNRNDCGWGTIIRTFRATDGWGLTSTNSCQQVITITEVHNYEIKFPEDAEANCGEPSIDTIEYNEIACDLLAVNVHDETYVASGDECYKLARRYRVINWCEWDGESAPQVVSRDEDGDNNPGDEDVYVLVRTVNGATTAFIDRDNTENPHWRETSSNGHWEYTQYVKVYDNVNPTVSVDDYSAFCSYEDGTDLPCTGDVTITFSADENCTPDDVTVSAQIDAFADGVYDGDIAVTGTYPNYTVSGNYPLGAHAFAVQVTDGCGNSTWTTIPFEVVDCKAPAPVCINGLALELMPVIPAADVDGDGDLDDAAVAIWASDFIASDIVDCTEPIKYSINKVGEPVISTQTGVMFTCDDDATVMIEIHAWDSANNPYAVQPDGSVGGPNHDWCETYVLVEDNNEICNTPGTAIAGFISTEGADAVEGADVNLSGMATMNTVTSATGAYEFANLAQGEDYTVTPQLDVNPLNGVSTFDLVLITKHILGVQLLDSPYKMIAADANNSESISTFDIIQLRKLILGLYTELPANTSWRFVNADYVFPNPSNPWADEFIEVYNVNNLAGDLNDANFVAVKIGDVNGSVVANTASTQERNVNGNTAFQVAEQAMNAGETYTVDFTAADLANLAGYQYTLTFDVNAVEVVDVEYGVAQAENFGMNFLNEGMITTSWNGTASNEEVLFSLVLAAKADANLSEVLGVSSRYTVAEAYTTNGDVTNVSLNFNNGVVATEGFALFQNTPNPFKTATTVGFNLPADAQVTIAVTDVTGKAVYTTVVEGVKGYNTVELTRANVQAAGIVYYTVSTDDYTATKKMIVVE